MGKERGANSNNVPFKSTKHNGRDQIVADAPEAAVQFGMKHSQRDEAREPEEHSQGIENEDDEQRCGARELERSERQVKGDDESPYGAKDEEADFRRRVDERVSVVPMRDYAWGTEGSFGQRVFAEEGKS